MSEMYAKEFARIRCALSAECHEKWALSRLHWEESSASWDWRPTRTYQHGGAPVHRQEWCRTGARPAPPTSSALTSGQSTLRVWIRWTVESAWFWKQKPARNLSALRILWRKPSRRRGRSSTGHTYVSQSMPSQGTSRPKPVPAEIFSNCCFWFTIDR